MMKKIVLAVIFCLLIGFTVLAEDRSVTIPKVKESVVVDGRLREDIWDEAAIFKFFFNVMNMEKAETKTLVFIMYDQTDLYIGFKFYDDDLAGIKAHQVKRDDPVYLDDSIELFLDPQNDGTEPYYHLVINANGVLYDELGFNNPSWDLDFTYAACRVPEEKLWNVEMKIPFASLGVTPPGEGTTWGLNLNRNRYRAKKEHSAWALTPIGFHQPMLFGKMIFGAAIEEKPAE